MQMTTVRVRRAKPDTLKAAGVDPGDRELVEVTAHGSPVAVVDVEVAKQGPRSRESDPIVWLDAGFAHDPLKRHIERVVVESLPIMGRARERATAQAAVR